MEATERHRHIILAEQRQSKSTMAKVDNENIEIPEGFGNDLQGLVLEDVIPRDRKPWYKDWTLWKLNLLLLCALLTQTATGFDASMINGMQSLPQWQRFFGE